MSTFWIFEMEIFKSNKSFFLGFFYSALRKTFFILKMTKRNEKTF